MQLTAFQLPAIVTNDATIIRWFLVHPNGQVFMQDELLVPTDEPSGIPESRRTDWVELPTPPVQAQVKGVVDLNGMPLAVLSDGSAYLWGRVMSENGEQADLLDHWHPFFEKIPMEALKLNE